MKKILCLVLTMITIGAFAAQKTAINNDQAYLAPYNKSLSDTIRVSKAKVIVLDSLSISVDDLRYLLSEMKKQKVPLMVDGQWMATMWGFIQTSRNGDLTTAQVEQLKVPLVPFIQAMKQQPAKP